MNEKANRHVFMNWDDYRFFLAVARGGQLSSVGRAMNVDHATVSRRIKALELELQSKLFDSSPQGYSLTAEGTELLPIAEQMEQATLQAEAALANYDKKLSGTVRIGVPDGVAAYVLSDVAKTICENYPKLKIQLIAMPQQFSLSKREVDFAITVSPPRSGRTKLRKITDYTLHLYGTKSYLEKAPKITSKADLSKHRGVGYVPELLHDKELDYMPLFGSEFELQLTSTSVHVQLHAILKGAGIGIVHDFMARNHTELIPVLKNEVSIQRSFWLTVHEDYAQIDRIRICMDAIVDHMRGALTA
ncbi:MAG: LysR family transcriptional regulator [Lentilitoribacter sp.]